MFRERASCLFHSLDADRISEALRRRIRLITAATLTSATPIVVVALMADVVIADVILSIEDSI
jgi:hypothetical protein